MNSLEMYEEQIWGVTVDVEAICAELDIAEYEPYIRLAVKTEHPNEDSEQMVQNIKRNAGVIRAKCKGVCDTQGKEIELRDFYRQIMRWFFSTSPCDNESLGLFLSEVSQNAAERFCPILQEIDSELYYSFVSEEPDDSEVDEVVFFQQFTETETPEDIVAEYIEKKMFPKENGRN